MRTARSRTSGEYLFVVLLMMLHPTQVLEPPANPARFRSSRGLFSLRPEKIQIRRLELAVPFDTTPEQIIQIQRAIEYAESLGIDMEVSFIR